MQIKLDQFAPRSYQLPIMDAVLNKDYKRTICILPRRAGKDITAFNICIRKLIEKTQTIFYCLPTYSSGRKIIWDAITNDGMCLLDYIPSELIESKNEQLMRIRLTNGSVFQIIGSDAYDTALVGTNPQFIVFSEFSLADPDSYKFVRPILNANDGSCLFISTPRGHNHLYDLWQIAKDNPSDWFSYKLTVEDTGHISIADIEKEKASGEMSEDLIMQEYYCSFSMGVEGSYYSKYVDKMKLDGRIGNVNWDESLKVSTAWDLGVRDNTCIAFFQIARDKTIRIIDAYDNNKEGLAHYAKVVHSKPYIYNRHIAPHDIRCRELGTGNTRLHVAAQLGINFIVCENVPVTDGIEAVRANFNKIYIDKSKCDALIKSLENYRQEWDNKKKIYKKKPLHDWASHWADCIRYLCVSLPKVQDGLLSSEQIDKNYREAMFGEKSNIPKFFR